MVEHHNLGTKIKTGKESRNLTINWSDLEVLISTMSSKFLQSTNLDEVLNDSLRHITIMCEVDRTFLFQFIEEGNLLKKTHEWSLNSRKLLNHQITEVYNVKDFPWWTKQISNGKIININNKSSMSMESRAFIELLEIQNIRSVLIFPIFLRSKVIGCIGFANKSEIEKWNDLDFSILRISSQLIGNAMDRYNMEVLLKNSKEKYRLIFENINDLITIVAQDYKIEYVNEIMAFKLLGYQESELIGKNYLEFIHPEDRDNFFKFFQKKLKDYKFRMELRIKHKHNQWIWFESRSKNFINNDGDGKWLISSRDLTEKKIAEERYKALFDNSPNAIILLDFKGKIIDSNSTVEKILGYDKESLVGKHLEDFNNLYSLDVKYFFKNIFHASLMGDFPNPIEAEIKTENEIVVWVKIQASLIKQDGKTLIQLIFEDITEKKKALMLEHKFKDELENEVKVRTKELNEALEKQKLYLDQIVKSSRFKTEFMATMSHELRTPLNAIIGFTDLLLEGAYGQINEEQREFITDIKSSAEHQLDMINRILDISKIESGQVSLNIQQFSLNSLINQIISSLKPQYTNKKLNFMIKNLNEDEIIYADPIKFKEILLNLLSNAIKFTIEGGISLIIKKDYYNWTFKVRDTGIGIDSMDYPLIFKEFQRVDSTYVRSVPGTGLGLSLTKRLIELHGGEITFFSLLGSGTTFTFNIPRKWEHNEKERKP